MPDDYFVNSDRLYAFYPDSIIATDEFDLVTSKIKAELQYIDDESVELYYGSRGLPFLRTFEICLEKLLTGAGYTKKQLREAAFVQKEANLRQNDYDQPEISAAFNGLMLLGDLKSLMSEGSSFDKKSIKIFLITLVATISIIRAGAVSGLARSQVRTIENSRATRQKKQDIIIEILKHIFNKYPKTPRTLGAVWLKLEAIKTPLELYIDDQRQTYEIKVGGNILLVTDGNKTTKYAKSSLRPFIKAFK